MRFGAAGAAELAECGVRRVEADHAFEVGDRDEQRAVGVSFAEQRVDFEHRVRGIAGVDAGAVIDDPLEDGQRAHSHATMLVDSAVAMEHHANASSCPVAQRGGDLAADAEALMAEGADAIVDGVDRLTAGWVVRAVTGIVDAWGRLDAAARAATIAEAQTAGARAAARVAGELRSLFALAPQDQRATPLEIVRSVRREATEVLAAAGIPEVERDRYDVRSFPDDVYGIVPKAITDLGDEDLGGALLAWGIGKARVLQERATPGRGGES